MESRQKLYKAGAKKNPTLSERVKVDKNRRKTARLDKFASSRQIRLDDSPVTPTNEMKISKIADRNEKLRAYRIAKNTRKFKEVQEQRSPFIVSVPVGRWLEKKERVPQARIALNATPVRALMNERALKKSTIKNLIGKSTVKKENVMTFTAQPSKAAGMKSKKKILSEINAMPVVSPIDSNEAPLPSMDLIDLNTTFEISPEKDEVKVQDDKRLRRSNSLPEIIKKAVDQKVRKILTPPAKKASVKIRKVISKAVKKPEQVTQAKKPIVARIVKPVIVPAKKVVTVPDKKLAVAQKVASSNKVPAAKPVPSETSSAEASFVPSEPQLNIARPIRPKVGTTRSETYMLYKSMLDSYSTSLTSRLEKIEKEIGSFIDSIDEEKQIFVRQAIQQGSLLTSDKLQRFEELLLECEDGLRRPDDPKRVTEDDVENYWSLVFDEINNLKEDFATIENMKSVFAASQKKRRTRRTYLPEDGTPKRSRRLAENAGTPKHNASCYGCVTMSASKINTPKSGIKRRTTASKSVLFKEVTETPKRSEGRRSTKRHKPTPARNLVRMDAVEVEDEDELTELL